jgi:hypothetical protein
MDPLHRIEDVFWLKPKACNRLEFMCENIEQYF